MTTRAEWSVMLGCRTESGRLICETDDAVDNERRNCWTSWVAFRGSLEACREFIRQIDDDANDTDQ